VGRPRSRRTTRCAPASGLPREYVLFVGTLEPRKDVRTLLAAHALLPDAPPLVLVGPPGWGEQLDVADAVTPATSTSATCGRSWQGRRRWCSPAATRASGCRFSRRWRPGRPSSRATLPVLREIGGAHVAYARVGDAEAFSDALARVLDQPPDAAAGRAHAAASPGRRPPTGTAPPIRWRCPDPVERGAVHVRLADQILEHVHLTQRQIAETRWDSKRGRPAERAAWPEAAAVSKITKVTSICNICGWRERGFEGVEHSESALCPVCGSIARDRFLYCAGPRRRPTTPRRSCSRPRPAPGRRVPRAHDAARRLHASDYDESMHKAVIRLDLQAIDLPDSSLDVVLTPHVLEHVPDTDKALSELFRVMKPGGHVFLQVPVPQAVTKVPDEPEYHGDMTLVYFRFGWDLADRIRSHGFACDTLVTQELRDAAAARTCPWTHEGPTATSRT
jgi:SAM-dependent methyltransferase